MQLLCRSQFLEEMELRLPPTLNFEEFLSGEENAIDQQLPIESGILPFTFWTHCF
jgi:hypothetical protein